MAQQKLSNLSEEELQAYHDMHQAAQRAKAAREARLAAARADREAKKASREKTTVKTARIDGDTIQLTGTGEPPKPGSKFFLVKSPNGPLSPYDADRLQKALIAGDADAIRQIVAELGVEVAVAIAMPAGAAAQK